VRPSVALDLKRRVVVVGGNGAGNREWLISTTRYNLMIILIADTKINKECDFRFNSKMIYYYRLMCYKHNHGKGYWNGVDCRHVIGQGGWFLLDNEFK
jgi:hypothetical protein